MRAGRAMSQATNYNGRMTLKLTNEQLAAVKSRLPGQPVQFEDEETQERFWLIPVDGLPALWADYVRGEVERGLTAIERGDVVPWDPEALKQLARTTASNTRSAE